MEYEMREHRDANFSIPAEAQNLMYGGYGSVDGKSLYEDRGQALQKAQSLGHVVIPCVMVLTEEKKRCLRYAGPYVESGWEPHVYHAKIMDRAVAIIERNAHIKIARPLWEVRPPEQHSE